MKKIASSFLQIIIISMLATSCEDIVDNVKIPESKEKLVVQCFISPQDTNIIVHVSRSVPIFNNYGGKNDPVFVPDADVYLRTGTDSVKIPVDINKMHYSLSTLSFPIIPGKTYHLRVKWVSMEVSASCTIPAEANNSLKLTAIEERKGEYQSEIWYYLSLIDNAGTKDFYRVNGWKETICSYTFDTDTFIDTLRGVFYLDRGQEVFEDKNKDGKTIKIKLIGWGEGVIAEEFDTEIISESLHFILLTTDEHYYKYHFSIFNYAYDNPFQEPSPVYTNIKNGLGVFSAYNKYSIMLEN